MLLRRFITNECWQVVCAAFPQARPLLAGMVVSHGHQLASFLHLSGGLWPVDTWVDDERLLSILACACVQPCEQCKEEKKETNARAKALREVGA